MVVYIIYIYIYIYIYGGDGPPGPKNARADFLSQSSPDLRVKRSYREVFITFEIWMFIFQNAWIRYRRPLFTPGAM